MRFRCAFHDVELDVNEYNRHCEEFHNGALITVMFIQEDEDE